MLIFNFNNGNEIQWQFRIKRLLVLCTKQISSSKTSAAIPMRILQIFTSFDTIKMNSPNVNDRFIIQFLQNCFLCLANENYFEIMTRILNSKIPEHAYEFETIKPSNEISRTILEMIERPLRLVNIGNNIEFSHQVISLFIAEILLSDFNFCTSNFIIPSLAKFPEFPYIQFVRTIETALNINSSMCNKKFIDRLRNGNVNAFLLYSVIKLDENKYDEIVSRNCMTEYISIIGTLLDNAVKSEKFYTNVAFDDFCHNSSESDNEYDDDDDYMDVEPSNERIMIHRSIELLNENERAERIVKLIDLVLCEQNAVQKMSLIVHNLIIVNQNANHENRIVGMLAYRPEVIRTLWYNLLTAKTVDQKLSISVMSRGMVIGKLSLV
jgi:ubiquitin-protein ligase E3 C